MQYFTSIETLTSTFSLSRHEMAEIDGKMPRFMASRLADKFVEENWPKIKANKKLMAEIEQAVTQLSASLIADLVVSQVKKALAVDESAPQESKND